ncbi:MAG: HK97 gp10 family phage protein [Oscillospiraceae bacterium]|nr:HK97 gp10 family phage protein [Oscillospiraceae bacterium]
MARWGNCDYKQLQQLRENLEKLQSMDLDKFCRDASKELAARLLALVIPRTPVGQYPKASGKKGGTLRRGWTAKTHDEAASGGGKTDAKAYASALPITKSGNNYTIEVINPVEYASYVEFGHRTPGGNGWVRGQYFLTLSEQELERIAPAILERKLEDLLREVFNV